MPSRSQHAAAHLGSNRWLGAKLHGAEQALLGHIEAILCRASGLGLMVSLTMAPGRFPAPARVIGSAYMFRFWRPASIGELLDIIFAILIWPLAIIFCVSGFTWKNGGVVAERFGRSRLRQAADQLRLVVTSGLAPPWYYVFELYRLDKMKRAPAYLTRAETKQGSNRLLAHARGSSSPLVNKEEFARFCNERQLKTLPVLFSVHEGELRSTSGVSSLPPTDLFVKPMCGCGGRGAERWDYTKNGRYNSVDGRSLSASELLDRVRRMSCRQPYLVQERARNHPAMTCLSNGALNTIRIITCLDERERPELIGGVLRMAIGKNVTVDNVHAGGIAAAVDLGEGRLTQATHAGMDARRGWIDHHPDTGARITGRLLPLWQEVRELVLRAHAAFDDWVVVGWDVAIMDDGPRLVEGNNGPDVDLIQRPLRTSFGDSRLGQLIALHLDRTEHVWRV